MTLKITYWTATAFICMVMLYSAVMYLTNYKVVSGFFDALHFPLWIIYPLAFLKLSGVAMILWRKNKWLMEWAYAGFFFDFLLAAGAHYHNPADDGYILPLVAAVLLLCSYFTGFYVRPSKHPAII